MLHVVYHADCMDGFCAAWVLSRRFGKPNTGTGTNFIPVRYGETIPHMLPQDSMIIADFSFPRLDLQRLHDQHPGHVTVLDHHKTSEEELKGLSFCQFDMQRSGAGMVWDHFFPSKPRPWIVNYVEDRDLWRFQLRESRAVNAYLQSLPLDFATWTMTAERGLDHAIKMGTAIQGYITRYTKHVAAQARVVCFEGEDWPIVNAPKMGISEALNYLCAEYDGIAMGWFQRRDGQYEYSLRSIGDFDVSEVAKRWGGGGHKRAAGFRTDTQISF